MKFQVMKPRMQEKKKKTHQVHLDLQTGNDEVLMALVTMVIMAIMAIMVSTIPTYNMTSIIILTLMSASKFLTR